MGKKTISKLVEEAHMNARLKGWWEEERSFKELIALMHSEASEALEDFRNGQDPSYSWYEKDLSGVSMKIEDMVDDTWKPCGIPSELADVVIRIFDACGRYGWGAGLEEAINVGPIFGFTSVELKNPFGENVTIIHGDLTDAARAVGDGHRIYHLANAVRNCYELARIYEIDLDGMVKKKMKYNATRPTRHGGKKL